ncbi:metallophosphoesterase [Flavobacterium salilacus subsp. salilacus]|uniref:metallophosphoesterase n=1 Tax=Flavobacterium TaxID=237 RepID=UPI0010757DBE|nr:MULTISPECIES: metallophosphoesterase [Flavobacterium]KAF2520027.1 metallophosphoesterase [Flavobacterium salilacus subsp. salilacus]MBE1614057.1 metallophosphoesterase [Flavobacterium sp. SaA2.13]
MFRWILLFVFVAVIEIYAFQALRTVTKLRWLLWAYQGLSFFIILYIAYSFTQFDRSVGQNKQSLFTIGLLLITFIPKIVIASMMFLEDVTRIFSGLMREFLGNSNESFFSERRKFVSQVALGLAAIPFLSLLYGVTKGKYNFKVRKKTIYFPDLPDNFDGLTITQISDVHSGSFDDPDEISHAIDLINEQKSDIILFTGDIVNTHATEMHPWVETFKRIAPPAFGKYSVLGNHDYGEYVTWDTEKEKQDNFEAIKDLHRQIDFKLLLNANVKIEKDGQQIALVGVENWGHNFKKAGDLPKASEGLTPEDFKILMSHDPSHWEYEVKDNHNNYHLTLSGHTHGLQFGIEVPGFIKWSPVQYIYKQWAGLYENAGRYVYVNRGFGFHAYPGRVGIWPEITVLELKKGQKIA